MYAVIVLILILIITGYQKMTSPILKLTYSEFLKKVDQGKITETTWESDRKMQGTMEKGGNSDTPFEVTIPPDAGQELNKILREKNVPVEAKEQDGNKWLFIVGSVLPYLLIIGFFILLFRQAQTSGGNQAFSFGRSKAKQVTDSKGKVTFDDVAGVEEAKEELMEVVDFLSSPARYKALGARIPKGVLLLGEPGTGKTLLGRAIAGEASVPFYYISGSDFVEMFVGVGASRVRDLFETAKKNAPCIIFVDEIDAVGRQRGAGLGGGHDEREQTLNQLLVEMDGFEVNSGVILIAATNRPDVLDPALLRPGRFDRHIVVSKPDVKGREAILKIHSRGKPLGSDVELEILGKRTPGFTGADLENLLNEAALLAARLNKDKIDMHDCEEAIDRVLMGPQRKSMIISEKEKKVIAYHEAGHALVAKLLPDANTVRKVTILPRGRALGATWSMPEEDKYLESKKELLAEITTKMGGRVSEEIVFNEITAGASNDLETATDLARRMITKFGMNETLGPVTFGRRPHQVFLGRDIVEDRNYSEDIANKIDREVRTLIEACYDKAKDLLITHRVKLEEIANILLEKEVLEGFELDKILDGTYRGVKITIDDNDNEEDFGETSDIDENKPAFPPVKGPDLAFE
ncbi:MAG: ATP-dependent zinc metalloprotease FtsH [Candidatus Eremiobacteraeota bacterium]|nr:ATP-dependent zinc metalloprotease FtsH [Candidatus Eremiobacteraeota bacterium]